MDIQLSDQLQHLSQQALQAMQYVREVPINPIKERTKLWDPVEVFDKGVQGIDEALQIERKTNQQRNSSNARNERGRAKKKIRYLR
jgi:hypothetical protein